MPYDMQKNMPKFVALGVASFGCLWTTRVCDPTPQTGTSVVTCTHLTGTHSVQVVCFM